MRHRAALFVAFALLTGCAKSGENAATDSSAAPAATNTKADEDSVRAAGQRMQAALTAHDTAAIAAAYADDGMDFTPGLAPAKGHAELAKEYGQFLGMAKDMKITMQPPEVLIAQAGDIAVYRTSYDMTWTDPKGKPAKDHGNVVIAMKKVNGAWKVMSSMNASDQPMPM